MIKRSMHRQRLRRAVTKMDIPKTTVAPRILDFGAGNGELARYIRQRHPDAAITIYEPSPNLMAEAQKNIGATADEVTYVSSAEEINGTFPLIFCLSVLEHPPAEMQASILGQISHLLAPGGKALVEVPNELYLAAAAKGLFRHARRPDAFDGRLSNICRAVVGKPPSERPLDEIGEGLPWHQEHLGFDHRELEGTIAESGLVASRQFSPVNALGSFASLDVYYTLTHPE